ncbi:hypothetical protein GcM1_196026 [Golovinomyces cichoracearum]|uniref:Uncharacterized protein n=1 Tax=Golovinomyces cichoracearum TaxID=62708 RepID=A0A420J053_9PEZI|nr:hypothetical protein GcM1_196026 [Golovinomyces cichoracearum]
MPSLPANFVGSSRNGAGLRYRDVSNSNWRDKCRSQNSACIDEERRYEKGNCKESAEEMKYETFTGESFIGTDRHPSQSMSVVRELENRRKSKDVLEKQKSVKFEDPNKDVITLEFFLNEGDLRKRARPMNIEDFLNEEEYTPKIRNKSHKRSQKVIRHLREIVGQRGKGPIDYKRLAEEVKVELSFLDLFQLLPDLSKASRNLSTRVNDKPDKMGEIFVQEFPSLFGEISASQVNIDQKAFRVPVTVKTTRDAREVKVTLPLSIAQADQGSDMIIATIRFLKKLGLPIKSLAERGFDGLTMNVADGSSTRLTYYSIFEIGVSVIWRKVKAFVRPCSKENIDDVHLLLGMPWPHAVDAKINIRESTIEVCDQQKGEMRIKVQ